MSAFSPILFTDNPAAAARPGHYAEVQLDAKKALASWRESLFSFEWLNKDGSIKTLDELPEKEKPRRAEVEESIRKNAPLQKPILGIGIMDNIEIGIGRPEFLTAAAHGMKTIPAHVPRASLPDFEPFLAKEKT